MAVASLAASGARRGLVDHRPWTWRSTTKGGSRVQLRSRRPRADAARVRGGQAAHESRRGSRTSDAVIVTGSKPTSRNCDSPVDVAVASGRVAGGSSPSYSPTTPEPRVDQVRGAEVTTAQVEDGPVAERRAASPASRDPTTSRITLSCGDQLFSSPTPSASRACGMPVQPLLAGRHERDCSSIDTRSLKAAMSRTIDRLPRATGVAHLEGDRASAGRSTGTPSTIATISRIRAPPPLTRDPGLWADVVRADGEGDWQRRSPVPSRRRTSARPATAALPSR